MVEICNKHLIKMEHIESTFPDSDDENLLLDDDNTKPSSMTTPPPPPPNSNNRYNEEERFESPEDSPLLRNERLNSFGHLTIKDFHCHHSLHEENNSDNLRAFKTLCIVSALCLLFMIIEFVGGYLAGSLAIMTDVAHLLSDLIGFFMSIVSIWIGRKMPTRYMTFGYHRAEVLGAFLSVLAVWFLAGVFFVLAIERIIKKEYQINADTMLIIAGIGLLINITMGLILHGSKLHTHSHMNINVRAAAAHIVGDLIQSVGVLIAALIIKLMPNAQIADPICTILFSVIVVGATLHVAKDSVLLLIEASPIDAQLISNFLQTSIVGVRHVHSLKLWSLAPGKEAVAVHLAVDENCDRDTILNQATYLLKKKLKIVSCTIQIEAYDYELISTCNECQHILN